MRLKLHIVLFLAALICLQDGFPAFCADPGVISASAPVRACRVIREYPHDPEAFTQGLFYLNGYLYEGTGLNGYSTLRKVELKTGRILKKIKLPEKYFGEGITVLNRRIFQLTWRTHTGFIYDIESFRQIGSFHYDTEGWGITTDGRVLIMSDGTDTLYRLDPVNCRVIGSIKVHDAQRPVNLLNELEYVRGEIFANVLGSDLIARISPRSGRVNGWIDLGILRTRFSSFDADVLNGIAFDSRRNRLFVTGKKWPLLFEIKID